MDYVLQLRKHIGHSPLLLVGATILVVNESNQLLLLKRSDNGCWGTPGGSLEPGEMVESAAKRETLEETNLTVGEMTLFGVFSGPELFYKYPNGDEVFNVIVAYLSHDWIGDVTLNDEHTEWRWFAANEIPDDLSPPIRSVIDKFKYTR
jgi:8-oxo-dGTP pyrophosphatase MutT (NUDIX family)